MSVPMYRDVLPLATVEVGRSGPKTAAFLGTGFLIAHGVLVTCWHVLRDAVESEQRVVALARESDDSSAGYDLSMVERDPAGLDMATARVPELRRTLSWGLSSPDGPSAGTRVYTYGYPLARHERISGDGQFIFHSRYLEGYVTRVFEHDPPRFKRTRSYELDMLAPAGISGAPLLRAGSLELMGVVYGSVDAYTIAEMASTDAETGQRTPEVQRIVSFALATDAAALGELRGAATDGKALREILASE